MDRVYVGVIAGILAVLLFATGMIASTMEPASVDAIGTPITTAQSTGDPAGISLALLSIFLGGGMVFMFRPKRRIYC